MPTLKAVRIRIRASLEDAGIETAEALAESRLILEHLTGWRLAEQIRRDGEELTSEQLLRLAEILDGRRRRIPLQYLTGTAFFRGLELEVKPGVFIPRPETELLVDVVLAKLVNVSDPLITDIGCGTGALAVSLLAERPDARAIAIDTSRLACQVTLSNADRAGVQARLAVENLGFSTFAPSRPLAALIANPPYIPRGLSGSLPPEVALHEPPEALFGAGDDGLLVACELACRGAFLLSSSGLLALEIGDGQAEAIRYLLQVSGWHGIEVHTDLSGMPRVVSACPALAGGLLAPLGNC